MFFPSYLCFHVLLNNLRIIDEGDFCEMEVDFLPKSESWMTDYMYILKDMFTWYLW